MWFGTRDGLNRYDGNSCTVFRHQFKDSNSLICDFVLSLNEDSANKLWIVPSELGKALEGLGSLFGNANDSAPEALRAGGDTPEALPGPDGTGSITRLPLTSD